MLLDLAQFNSFDRVSLKHSPDEVLAIRRDLHGHSVVSLFDFHKEHCKLLVVKRERSTDHGVQNHSTAPDVDFLSTILLA